MIEIDHAWTQEREIPEGSGEFHTFTHDDNKAFWDDYYDGYTAPDACDYTQNCHGYAFGVGDWPDSAAPMIDQRPITEPPTPDPPPCFVVAEVKDAQIAVDPAIHSIKVQGTECEVDQPPEPPIPVPDPEIPITNPGPGGPPMAQAAFSQALVASWEQYAESGTYSQTGAIPFFGCEGAGSSGVLSCG